MADNPINLTTRGDSGIAFQYFAQIQLASSTPYKDIGGIEAIAWNGVRTTHNYRTFKYDAALGPTSLHIDEVYPGHVSYTGNLRGISLYSKTSFLENFEVNSTYGYDILRQNKALDIHINIYKANAPIKPVWSVSLNGLSFTKIDIEFDMTADDPKIVQEMPFTFQKLTISKG